MPHPLTLAPNKLTSKWQGAKAVRYFADLPKRCQPILIDKDKNFPLLVLQENVMGKGKNRLQLRLFIGPHHP